MGGGGGHLVSSWILTTHTGLPQYGRLGSVVEGGGVLSFCMLTTRKRTGLSQDEGGGVLCFCMLTTRHRTGISQDGGGGEGLLSFWILMTRQRTGLSQDGGWGWGVY